MQATAGAPTVKHGAVVGVERVKLASDPSEAFTVIIPAHNEAAVIGRTLRSFLAEAPSNAVPDVLVIANGCTDDTAVEARRASPDAKVIELTIGSKSLAINTGLRQTRAYPVIILDGDIVISFNALQALAQALREPGVMAASPGARLVLDGSDKWVTAFYRAWIAHDYLQSGVGGSGVYGLSEIGARQLGELPPIIADDTYVRRTFPLSQQRRVQEDAAGRPVFSVVRAPQRIANLLNCEARWHSGNVQLRTIAGDRPKATGGEKARPKRLGKAKRTDVAVYYTVKLLGRGLYLYNKLRGRARHWHRDSSRR